MRQAPAVLVPTPPAVEAREDRESPLHHEVSQILRSIEGDHREVATALQSLPCEIGDGYLKPVGEVIDLLGLSWD